MTETISSTMIRVPDTEAVEMLRKMADVDIRSMGNEVAWLIRQEYARRNQPALVTESPAATGS